MVRALILAALVLAPSAAAHAAGFDCAKARSVDEKAVCADPVLSDLDTRLAKANGEAKAAGLDMRPEARGFLADRKSCGAERTCLIATYLGILETMRRASSVSHLPKDITAETLAAGKARDTGALPDRLGTCTATRIDDVHPRLGEEGAPVTDADFDSGTGVDYANGGYQVSYDRMPDVIASKAGDPVVMCLVALPHDCPPGDDRGREYLVTNTRTGASWIMPDSQHSCGGA